MNLAFIIEMPQQLKAEVRARMLAAAAQVFAEAGYANATMAAIAQRAGVATGNLYRYFADKDALFYTVVDDAVAETFLRLLRRRVKSLVQAEDLTRLDPAAQRDGEALLAFWVAHRLQVIILLDGAAGSRFEDFPARFVEVLMRATLARLKVARPDPKLRLLLEIIFTNTVRALVAILEQHESEADVREAFAGFWSYQLAGLSGLEGWVKA